MWGRSPYYVTMVVYSGFLKKNQAIFIVLLAVPRPVTVQYLPTLTNDTSICFIQCPLLVVQPFGIEPSSNDQIQTAGCPNLTRETRSQELFVQQIVIGIQFVSFQLQEMENVACNNGLKLQLGDFKFFKGVFFHEDDGKWRCNIYFLMKIPFLIGLVLKVLLS